MINKIIASLFGMLLSPLVAYAGPIAQTYFTNTSTGTENSAIITTAPGVLVKVFEVCNYNTSSPLTGMFFDASSLPANGSNPQGCLVSNGPATSANQPSCNSCLMAADGLAVQSGVTLACSTTGKQLTVDTTSGGDCKFFLSR